MKKSFPGLQSGMFLIEVMVSLTILVLGLVGLAVLQARALMMNQSSYYRSIAADLATDLADRIRANRSPFLATTASTTMPDPPPDFSKCTAATLSTSTCTAQSPTTLPTYLMVSEMIEWYSAVQNQLPSGTFTLASIAAAAPNQYRYTLTITWLDDRTANTTATINTSYSVVIE